MSNKFRIGVAPKAAAPAVKAEVTGEPERLRALAEQGPNGIRCIAMDRTEVYVSRKGRRDVSVTPQGVHFVGGAYGDAPLPQIGGVVVAIVGLNDQGAYAKVWMPAAEYDEGLERYEALLARIEKAAQQGRRPVRPQAEPSPVTIVSEEPVVLLVSSVGPLFGFAEGIYFNRKAAFAPVLVEGKVDFGDQPLWLDDGLPDLGQAIIAIVGEGPGKNGRTNRFAVKWAPKGVCDALQGGTQADGPAPGEFTLGEVLDIGQYVHVDAERLLGEMDAENGAADVSPAPERVLAKDRREAAREATHKGRKPRRRDMMEDEEME